MTAPVSQEHKEIQRRLNWELPEPLNVPEFKNAACAGLPTEWWFPEKDSTMRILVNTRKAVSICHSCVEQRKCADFALDNPSVQGIWGGLSIKRRQRARTIINHAYPNGTKQGLSYSEMRNEVDKGPRGPLSI